MSLSKDSETERLNPGIWKVTSVAVLGSFFAQIDATVVNVSLSTLAVELHSSLTAIQWVTSGYLLALAVMLPLSSERLAGRAHWSAGPLPLVLLRVHALLGPVRLGLVGERADRVSRPARHERRSIGADGADDGG